MNDNHTKFAEDIGYIKGTVKSIKEHVEKQNGDIASLQNKVAKHDVIFGKIGVVFTGLLFVITTVVTITVDWVKTKF